jgi:exopolyphosphatase/guanosine-5'-triphosphate,3'-diphosphate pyrophosphatase
MVNRCVIDIGSNTIKIFIAEIQANQIKRILEMKRRMSRLGQGLKEGGYLSSESKQVTLKHLKDYINLCNKHHVDRTDIMVTATAACRNAADGQAFIKKIKNKFNLQHVKILSGTEEAQYTFSGVLESIPDNNKEYYYVIDIGGGSFQIAAGQKENFLEGKSFQMGGNSATEKFKLDQPISIEQLQIAINYFKNYDTGTFNIPQKPVAAVGAGGTIKIMQLMIRNPDDQSPLMLTELRETAHFLSPLTTEERFHWFKNKYPDEEFREDAGLTLNRAEVFLAGVIIVLGILENLKMKSIIFSNTDAKDYVIKLSGFNKT